MYWWLGLALLLAYSSSPVFVSFVTTEAQVFKCLEWGVGIGGVVGGVRKGDLKVRGIARKLPRKQFKSRKLQAGYQSMFLGRFQARG